MGIEKDIAFQMGFTGFNRNFLDPATPMSVIGKGNLGGKAQGLASIRRTLHESIPLGLFPEISVDIPALVVLRTGVFDSFLLGAGLDSSTLTELSQDRIIRTFQQAEMPFEVLGDLRALIENVHTPLAIRSSSLLEDAAHEPFAGIYETKMIPNAVFDPDARFRQLIDAIKFVYASTFSEKARQYRQLTGHKEGDEKMAVVIQEMVGTRHSTRFYPELSGVMRSYNYYPMKPALPADGVVSLALGLGKTIVDGGVAWSYSPAYPMVEPPFVSVDKLLEATQTKFWAVNMGDVTGYEPFKETEYMVQESIAEADEDGTLYHLASTYDPVAERLLPGTGVRGPRALTFSPLLVLKTLPFNDLALKVLRVCEKSVGAPVEVEFAMTFDPNRFSLLQVRPMTVPSGEVHLTDEDLEGENVLAAAEIVLGNGIVKDVHDIVYVKTETFDLMNTDRVVPELVQMNRKLLEQRKPYLLVVYGRLGTTDPWTGISINWEQVAGAKAIVEATREDVKVELSQGSHYFLNLINLGVMYFTLPAGGVHKVDWDWLNQQQAIEETTYLRHIELTKPLLIKVDGKSAKGVILKP
jgi:hypothetical protein